MAQMLLQCQSLVLLDDAELKLALVKQHQVCRSSRHNACLNSFLEDMLSIRC